MARTHPLKRLARQQKRDLNRLTWRTEDSVHNAFGYARRSVEPTLGEFARAYGEELARAKAAMDESELFAHVPLHWLLSSGWGQRVKASIATAAHSAGQQSLGHISQAHATAALAGERHAIDLLHEAMKPATQAGFGWVPRGALQALQDRIIGRAGNGGPLGDLFAGFGAEASKKAQSVLYSALVTGTNPRAVASQLAGVLDVSRNRALVIARTELIDAYRNAQLENFRANSDVLAGWMWSAHLGSACIACTEMDGTVHSLDEDLDDHPSGACSPIPVTRTWDEILADTGIDASDIPDTRITTGYQSGADWFDEQDAETQRDILGPAKFAAVSRGDLDPADLVGQKDDGDWGNPIYEKSLKELGLDASDYIES